MTLPRAVLSEHLEERLRGRRLLAGVFMTFRFDPAFFEQDILPIFFDIPLSHAAAVKLVQLDEAVRAVPHGIAVYYDRNGIVPGAAGSRLDVRRIPICHRTGIFHPKNMFALVEDVEPDEAGHKPKALIVASLSANLTRPGWWENVESCHTEEIGEDDFTVLRKELLGFLSAVERWGGLKATDDHAAVGAIRAFLKGTGQRTQRSIAGRLHPRFFTGRLAFTDFLDSASGRSLRGLNLEVISPYFDERASSLPLEELTTRLQPKEVRVFLPRSEAGEALCSQEIFDHVRGLEGVSWGHMPADIQKTGRSEGARARTVHAKMYRFFQVSPRREVIFVGSVNLTSPAHRLGGNVETGFLVEVDLRQRPDWWLLPDTRRPARYLHRDEAEETATSGGTRLALRYWWNTGIAEAFWDATTPAPELTVSWQSPLFTLRAGLPAREWTRLGPEESAQLGQALESTSILQVAGDGREPGHVLVQEEGMHARPSLLFELTPAEILRYWSLLTPAQKAEFLNARAPLLALTDEGAALLAQVQRHAPEESFFDRFAGIFLAFGCLERAVRQALPSNQKQAAYRLFGRKYDSLANLLSKMAAAAQQDTGELTEPYVTALCARQLVRELEEAHPAFFEQHRQEADELKEAIAAAASLRDRLVQPDPAGMPEFLDWFENWFVRRAAPVEADPA